MRWLDSITDSMDMSFSVNPLQYSCLENPMDRGNWWATVHEVAKGRTQLSDFTFTFSLYQWKRDKHYRPVVDSFTRYLDIRSKP